MRRVVIFLLLKFKCDILAGIFRILGERYNFCRYRIPPEKNSPFTIYQYAKGARTRAEEKLQSVESNLRSLLPKITSGNFELANMDEDVKFIHNKYC